MFNRQKIILDA